MDVNDDTFKGDDRTASSQRGATTAAEIELEETTSLVPPELGNRDQLRVDDRNVSQLEDQLEMLERRGGDVGPGGGGGGAGVRGWFLPWERSELLEG